MHSLMYEIRDFIQNLIESTSLVIEFDIYVIDDNLVRVAGTGIFKKIAGMALPEGCGNDYVIKNEKLLVIENPLKNEICSTCPMKEYNVCSKEYSIIYPVKIKNKCIGSIAIASLTPELKARLVETKNKLIIFLKKLSEIIVTKIRETETEYRLMTILNSISEGIVLTDFSGNIIEYNDAMKKILQNQKNIKNIFSGNYFENIINNAKENSNQEWEVDLTGLVPNNRMFVNVKFINRSNEKLDILFTFKHKKELSNIAYQLLADASHLNINFDSIIGNSKAINEVKSFAVQAAKHTSNVLILGESGTGKELFARAIHRMSEREKEPFIAINCAAIPENLLESELFGYESGAFTGANKGGKPGKFELANGGTIFLDEVGDLALYLQPKLLRVIENGELQRVGGVKPIKLDVRIIAATNKNLESMVEKGEFRQDLFYRLCVIPITIPSLKERPEDIILLAEHFLHKYNRKFNKNIKLSEEVRKLLLLYDWPGNVRELENTIEYSVNMENRGILTPKCIPEKIRNDRDDMKYSNLKLNLDLIKKRAIQELLIKYGNTLEAKQKIAKEFGISISTLYREIKKYNL
ncbi:sigma 54-interacting transcriptional regulator [Clostridium sp. PL3]|uniref:Sigma 54-interacting transcriptional regulator n=1 Tax=Clostridium thailandense TaxID=2794346 RepID=A0A949TSY8_9CLOT|nr:sigma 54-interacting transcriptional regulator [Clostridium thailandense]MBV7271306.1 sigma 54-interacting transcriptional regulator [Clostridium thailandense]